MHTMCGTTSDDDARTYWTSSSATSLRGIRRGRRRARTARAIRWTFLVGGREDSCLIHEDPACRACPRYEWTVEWEHGKQTGFFWVGQDARMMWGSFGDGVTLDYHEGEHDG